MTVYMEVLLILHFLGLAMGLSVSFANMVMAGLISTAEPPERAVLGRFPPVMGRVGKIGLATLWVTGLLMFMSRGTPFAAMPWQFHAKLTAVTLLTLLIVYIHRLERRARTGDRAAAARIPNVGRGSLALAVTAVIFAVLTFR
ncbi:MAG: hypothetical protein ABI910_08565 [Gemmatimonadota bacterium]